MSDLRNLTRDFLREFIELYRAHPCLWQTKSKDYVDKNKKNEAYKILLKKLTLVQSDATKSTVIQKINSLRGGFRREFKKVTNLERSGAGPDDVYVPTLWYYELMKFVKDQEVSGYSASNVQEDDSSLEYSYSEHVDENNYAESDIEVKNEYSPESSEAYNSEYTFLSYTPSSSTSGENRGANKRHNYEQATVNKTDEILNNVGEKINTSDDEFSIIGKNVAIKLRRMSRETKIYTEKLINDLLFKAELGQIDQNTIISTSEHEPNNTISTVNHL